MKRTLLLLVLSLSACTKTIVIEPTPNVTYYSDDLTGDFLLYSIVLNDTAYATFQPNHLDSATNTRFYRLTVKPTATSNTSYKYAYSLREEECTTGEVTTYLRRFDLVYVPTTGEHTAVNPTDIKVTTTVRDSNNLFVYLETISPDDNDLWVLEKI